MLNNTPALQNITCGFIEVTPDGNNIRMGFGRNGSYSISQGDESTKTYADWNGYQGQTGDQGYGITTSDVVFLVTDINNGNNGYDGDNIDWTNLSITGAGCESPPSADIVINAQPATPSAPVAGTITQPTCATATGSFTIASFESTSTYTFTPTGPTVDGTTGEVTLAAGATYTFTETNAAGCISAVSADVVIDAQPATPSAPVTGTITQPTCATATASFTIASFESTSTYTFTPSGPTVDGSGVVTLAAGATYTFTETNAAGCISAASLDVVIVAQPATPSTPVAGTITQPTCAVATGSFTIANFDATST